MAFFAQTGPSARGRALSGLGQALGSGIGKGIANREDRAKRGALSKRLFGDEASGLEKLSPEEQLALAKYEANRDLQKEKLVQSGLPQYKPITVKDLTSSWANRGFDKEALSIIPQQGWEQILDRANELQSTLGPDKAIIQAEEEYLNPEKAAQQQAKREKASEEKLLQDTSQDIDQFEDLQDDETEEGSFARGIRSTIAGRLTALLNDVPYDQYEASISLGDDPNFVDRMKYMAAKLSGDLPFIGAGATLGGSGGAALGGQVGGPYGVAVGGILGGGAGALSLPAVLDTALEEYHKFKSNGYEGSFEDFLKAADKTLQVGTESAIEGAIFGTLSKALGPIKKASPLFAKFLEKSPAREAVATGAVEATGLLAAKTAAKGELPSKEEIADTLAQVISLNVVHSLPKAISEKIAKTGRPVESVVKDIDSEIKSRGYDRNDVKQVERAITDVTKKYEGEIPKQARDIFEVLKKVGEEAPKPAEEAKALSQRNIEKTFKSEEAKAAKKERGPTKTEAAKMEAASEEVERLDKKISKAREDIEVLKKGKEKKNISENQYKTYDNAIRLKEDQIKNLETQRKEQEYTARKGVEPFSEKKLEEPIKKHLSELEAAAKDPEGTTAKAWENMFKRDQKYIDEFEKLATKKKLPEAKYKDRFIKTLEAYKKSYENQIRQVEDNINNKRAEIKDLDHRTKLSRNTKKEIDNLKRKLDLLRKNKDINEAKIGRQVDKLNQMYALNKPGSPLTKQILKGLRREVPQLQKDFIKQKKQLEALDKQSQKAHKKGVENLKKVANEYYKKPSDIKLKELVDESGVKPEQVRSAKNIGKEMADNLVDDIKKDAPKQSIMKSIEQSINKLPIFNQLPQVVSKQAAYALASIAITELKEGVEKAFGFKVPYTGFNLALGAISILDIKRGGAFYIYNTLYKQIKEKISTKWESRNYRNLKTPQDKIKYIRKLKDDGYTPTQIKEIKAS